MTALIKNQTLQFFGQRVSITYFQFNSSEFLLFLNIIWQLFKSIIPPCGPAAGIQE